MNPRDARVLIVGMGGIGCPAALALARSGVGLLGMCDDDVVDESNLHRQILFREADVGSSKLDAAALALEEWMDAERLRIHRTRLLPANAVSIVGQYDLVLEGSDNFETKFLTADACSLARVPVVHASAVRWIGTALAVGRGGRPCYRCLFEDLLDGVDAPNCSEAGVLGPVVGVIAALQVDLGLSMLEAEAPCGELATYDGRTDVLRRHRVSARLDCLLCGNVSKIDRIDARAYESPACAG